VFGRGGPSVIGRWFKRLGLRISIAWRRFRLSRMRNRLKDLQIDIPATRPVVRNELRRLRSLERELRAVRNEKQLRYWRMRLEMATPYLKAPFIIAKNTPRQPKARPGPKPQRRSSRSKTA